MNISQLGMNKKPSLTQDRERLEKEQVCRWRIISAKSVRDLCDYWVCFRVLLEDIMCLWLFFKIFILIFLFLHEKYWVCAVIMCVTNHCDDMKLSTSIINTNSQARNGVSAERVNIFLARISSWRECMLFALQICKCFWIGKLNFYADGDSQRKMNLWFSWCL